MKRTKIGVIGRGVVGSAVFDGISAGSTCELSSFDKFKPETNIGDVFETDLVFVCVPTPTKESDVGAGGQDLSAVLEVLQSLSLAAYKGVVVIKSTVLPGSMNSFKTFYSKLRLVHNPEFLNAKTALQDFLSQTVVLLSGDPADVEIVENAQRTFLGPNIISSKTTDYRETEFAKYIHNCVLPVQLSFLNEVYDLCDSQKQFDNACDMAENFGNLNGLHAVPGPDGQRGWGGMCFPKDMRALYFYAKYRGKDTPTLTGAIRTNRMYRSDFK